ncbi:MAG TPA: 4Fe-4S binding protein [Candidatus Nanopelagicaceae bacterium]|nr:4Fe-4S binding protein [Candidatus Nanopelagicaceae bacterium]
MTEAKFKASLDKLSIKDFKIFIKEDICNGCGLCAELCPFGLPQQMDSGKYEINNPKLCTECSACKRNCPVNAIIMMEKKGCGCLWNARANAKNTKSGNKDINSCACGSGKESEIISNCCG